MRKRLRTPVCPYCGNRLNYVKAWVLKRRGEYICPKCGGLSNVALDPLVRGAGALAFLAGAVFCLLGCVFSELFLISLAGIACAGLVFAFLAPLFVRLRKPKPPRRSDADVTKSYAPPGRRDAASAPRRDAR